MLVAGIAWTARGFDVAFRDTKGETAAPPVHFAPGRLAELSDHLAELDRQVEGELVCVVDSTNGMVDGRLLARGLRVHRADPWQLPERPNLGSVSADALAEAGVSRELPCLVLTEGSLTSRSDDHARHSEASASTLTELAAAGRCVVRGAQNDTDPVVALTFDDGPNPPWTGRILDTLAAYDVPATFFCIGLHASGHPELLARMTEAGHRVANHTWSHPFLPDLSLSELDAQLERTDEAIERGTGLREPRLFRPPYGSGTPEIFSALGRYDEAAVVLWDVDTNDWAMPGSDVITAAVLEQARPGSIVLMHDGGGDRTQTADALPGVIEGLLGRGYRFARIDDLPRVSRPESEV